MLNDHDIVGIVHFENNAKVTLGMTLTSNPAIRNKIYKIASNFSSNGRKSNIWNGKNETSLILNLSILFEQKNFIQLFQAFSLALTLLRTTLDINDRISPTGGNIVLITNSMADTNYPNRNSIIEQVIRV
jgi:hypothetical protein